MEEGWGKEDDDDEKISFLVKASSGCFFSTSQPIHHCHFFHFTHFSHLNVTCFLPSGSSCYFHQLKLVPIVKDFFFPFR